MSRSRPFGPNPNGVPPGLLRRLRWIVGPRPAFPFRTPAIQALDCTFRSMESEGHCVDKPRTHSSSRVPGLPPTILLADLPPMLEDVVSNVLRRHFDLRVTRAAKRAKRGCSLLNEAVEAGSSVVVVVQDNPADLSSFDPYLANAAQVSVVAIALDGSSACLHAFKPSSQKLEDVSAQQIVTAIADAVAAARG
jgi:hypothetical protein